MELVQERIWENPEILEAMEEIYRRWIGEKENGGKVMGKGGLRVLTIFNRLQELERQAQDKRARPLRWHLGKRERKLLEDAVGDDLGMIEVPLIATIRGIPVNFTCAETELALTVRLGVEEFDLVLSKEGMAIQVTNGHKIEVVCESPT